MEDVLLQERGTFRLEVYCFLWPVYCVLITLVSCNVELQSDTNI